MRKAYELAGADGSGADEPTAGLALLASQVQQLRAGIRALRITDGEGRNSVRLAARGLIFTAFDFSPVALAKAAKPAALLDLGELCRP